ncbi:HET-domain-containing protein [Xylaria grammica]|nr:HET-domain-containing protein [Xylaria grammica]
MQSTDSTDRATTSRPAGHPDSERCPGNLCAHVSSPLFKNDNEKEDIDSLLHNFCNNCASQAEQEPLCDFCRHLRLRHLAICLRDKLTGLHIKLDLGSDTRGSGISRILSNKECVLCSLVANTIHSYFVTTKKHDEDEKSMQAKTSLSLSLKQKSSTRCLILRLRGLEETDEIEIAYREPSEDSIPTVGGLIDWPTVQQWISQCTDHRECKRLEFLTMPEGFHLIDVNNWKLVSDFPSGAELGRDIKFVALSYVWGKKETSRNDALLASNKDELATPGGLGKIILPKAIEDAITICQQLHHRFLWVDRFCIQQDDKGPKEQTQINAMGDIYSSAEFTIIHASGTSFEDPIAGVTVTREALQSKTVLFFTPLELWFECSYSYAPYQREEQCSQRRQGWSVSNWDKSIMTQFGINNFVKSTTQFQDFVRHLESYTARSLTYPLDVLNAFMGILTTLYKTDLGIYGLPETDFDQALLWYCKTEQMPKMNKNSFPSWSWASVSGIITAPTIYYNEGFLGPLVQWSYKDQNGELKIVRSRNSLHPRDTQDTRNKPDTNAQAHLLVAWWKGCIEPAVPEDVKQELEKYSPASEKCAICESKIAQRWPDLEEVWKSIESARNSGIRDTQYLAERLSVELQPGVLLTRAQTAYFKVSLEGGIYFVDSEGRRIGIIRPEYTDNALGIKAGTAQTDSLECIGISLSGSHKLAPSNSTSLDSDRELKMIRGMARVLNALDKREPQPEDLIGVRQSAVNVLIIHREGGPKESPFARRIGVGWVYLANWIEADRVFKTIGLK